MKNTIQKAVIYVGTAREKQAGNNTIQKQLSEVRKYAQGNGYMIVKEYIENGFSDATLKRPVLLKLLEDAKKKEFTKVIVRDYDRLSRQLPDFLLIESELKKNGVSILPITEDNQIAMDFKDLFAPHYDANKSNLKKPGITNKKVLKLNK
ncbi:MAG: hypothetical protein A3C50_01260 [Candidatus Staskawiczbacteria bacterium RIFCSPHIGHO2_02_FULL_43_16]|uniref:Resolvase/invertase-type recombinase catalytic domain-containing protein n=1 Tax=Candidatus Staskawiczbacteria bacterium RIFCSPHIGHO2_01_FULL_41_41 TaxID=1802203 RepID=A0A1G2HUW6_9BACT|nr:MAG: hypothetical protein A2822_04655 [Candidatus Staskawiczbacteria bacterium RIFCSPHIGHO2_01_FULL_41_41]OGZ68837.1 MAG: hypothetical protein A3C50_01260 [Candidatus Staskawiczbacteria bacterium RIFCSPHIGHO2_02_FULL_43_16]OGZ74210.1 MAG: hypothetical protein A3A12_00250 [Candidatus Staskawiczbacteria bacterium RIFCSPLOWO2_01_FULL_43_17b]